MSAPSSPGPRNVRSGDVVGDYRLEAEVGEGAMGRVFRAAHRQTGERVALKVLRGELSTDPTYRSRFLREARVAETVDNRHLVRILGAGEDNGVYYLAARYINGGTLADHLEREPQLPITEALTICSQIGSALDAVHRQAIVHRDVKPSNIMLDESAGALLTDYGLAKGAAFTRLTATGVVLGTIDYLAPEALAGEAATAACDVYGLGCIAYESLTGAAPFARYSGLQLAVAIMDEDPPDPRERRSELSPGLAWAVLSALAKNPNERPGSARAFTAMLQAEA